MNENVTNKTPKRRRWIARLLVSALCILLASSLLFVGVVADVVSLTKINENSLTIVNTTSQFICVGLDSFVYVSGGYLSLVKGGYVLDSFSLADVQGVIGITQYVFGLAFDSVTSKLYLCNVTDNYLGLFTVIIGNDSFLSSSFARYYIGSLPSGLFNCSIAVENGKLAGIVRQHKYQDYYDIFFSWELGDFTYIAMKNGFPNKMDGTDTFLLRSCSVAFNGVYYFPYFGCAMDFEGNILFELDFPVGVRNGLFILNNSVCITGNGFIYSYDALGRLSASYQYFDFYSDGRIVGFSSGNKLTLCRAFADGTIFYTASFEDTSSPPESSGETTTEPPPESSEPGEPGMFNIYRTDIDRSGGVMVFNSTLYTSIPSDGLESLSAYLGYYWDVDSSVQPPPSYMYLLASYEDGTRQRYDFDFSAYGYALGSDFAQNFYYPDYLGMEFEIPLNGETDIYFVTSSPGGSVTVENSDGRIITLNFGSTSSYARIDFVDELNYRITLYNNDMAIGNSLTFDHGVYRYLFVYNVDSAVNTWYYPESGTFTLINYDKVENGLYNVVLTLNDKIPDYGKPGDFEDAVSWYEEIEGAVSSTMSETWEYLESLQEELNGSFDIVEFSEANAKLDQILSTPGGDTIFTFFKSLWGINPLLPTFAVMTVCFAGVTFIIRKI